MDDLRHLNIYVEDLKSVGIRPSIEQLSQSTVTKRMDNHDFDLFWVNWSASRLRDPEAEWHSSTADQIASNNYAGLKDKVIDSLVEVQKTEMDMDKSNDILRSIDKRLCTIVPYVLLWEATIIAYCIGTASVRRATFMISSTAKIASCPIGGMMRQRTLPSRRR